MLTLLAKKNKALSIQIENYIKENTLKRDNKDAMTRLYKNIEKCAQISSYRVGAEHITYIGSHTCDSRNCNICNWKRQKKIRNLYRNFFHANKELVLVQNLKCVKKIITESVYANKFEKDGNYKFVGKREYDLMHLTLTVPHTKETGYKNQIYYFSQIIADFNQLRKRKDWLLWVYGGEYGVETTVTEENGLHTHIHSLLFVRKATNSRNELHKVILKEWNVITAIGKKEISENRIPKIMIGNKLLTADFVKELNGSGATLIGLETIYTLRKTDGVTEKVRTNEFGSEAMERAVMETISYHFEPQAFDKKFNQFNLDLLCDILPKIHKQKLYGRFGCIQNEKSLQLKNDLAKEYEESLDIDTETGEIMESEHYVVKPYKVYHDLENDLEIKIHKSVLKDSLKLNAFSTRQAVSEMNKIVKNKKHV